MVTKGYSFFSQLILPWLCTIKYIYKRRKCVIQINLCKTEKWFLKVTLFFFWHCLTTYEIVEMMLCSPTLNQTSHLGIHKQTCSPTLNQTSHLGIHKQINACRSLRKSQTSFFRFKICRKLELWGPCCSPVLLPSMKQAPAPE